MIQTGFEKRVQVQQILANQLPDYIRAESPKTLDFLKQYYISQEHQSGVTDLTDNLDQYIKLDNLTPEVITGKTTLYSGISSTTDSIQVFSTKGFPDQYGLFKIDDEICTYTGLTTNTFTGVIRGFTGITSYRTDLNTEELLFEESNQASHDSGKEVKNLSVNFLKEFYKKLKYTLTPGLENVDFVSDLDVNNFIKESRAFYEAKGTEESFKILFKVLYGETPIVIDLEKYLPKPSSAEYIRREIVVAERISGDPDKLVGQTIKKASDLSTQASVSEVEIFTRSGITTYFKLGLFVGFDDRDLIEGTFEIQPKTSNINPVSVGSSVITVDSTIGFGVTGTLLSGGNIITYSSKTVNQFLGCVGVDNAMGVKSPIRTNDVFFGYEEGDLDKKVEIRITGVLSDVETIGDVTATSEGEKIYVKNVGEKIKNPTFNKTQKEIFANSWIYNTSSRFFVDNTNNGYNLISTPDSSALKVGDRVDVLIGSSEVVAHTNAIILEINDNRVKLDTGGNFTPSPSINYSLRRKLETANSVGAPLIHGNDLITADIQNVYTEKENCFYVASNSLPSYQLTKNLDQAIITSLVPTNLQNFNTNKLQYSVLVFNSDVPFNTGDEVIYNAENNTIIGLEDGVSYFVRVLTDRKKIQLYRSRSLIDADNTTTPTLEYFSAPATSGFHKFTIVSQKTQFIHPQKLLRKFPYNLDVKTGENSVTAPGALGMLVNGVEVINYKSEDKVYYGPLDDIRVYNGGTNFDVVNLPSITVSGGVTTALVQPVVKGKLTDVLVDPQDFDIKKVSSVTITGGNSSGVVLEAQLEERNRELKFDGRQSTAGGGVDVVNDTISFPSNHNLISGDEIIYSKNGNNAIGVGIRTTAYQDGQNLIVTGLTLNNGSVYIAEVVNNKTINLYQTVGDYSAGINTVGFTTAETSGIHKFRTKKSKNTISKISIVDFGTEFENRKLIVQPTGISTAHDTIFFKNHGFNDGEVITYSTDGTIIGGLDTNLQYKVIKLNENEFRLANAGAAGTITANYDRNNYVNIVSAGSSEQFFAYPPINVTVNADIIGGVGVITATPVIKGSISDVYLYNNGTGYGSKTINFHKKPDIFVKTGKNAELKPIIDGGKIINVQVTNTGSEYTSPPDLEVVGIGSGTGAKLRAVIENQKVVDVVVLNTGIGYTAATTSIKVTSSGANSSLEASVRHLTLNDHERHGDEILTDTGDGLQYGMIGYSTSIGLSEFGDDSIKHSPIIGWAYDGNPIYGPYGYDDSSNNNSQIRNLSTSYVLSPSSVIDRPTGFANGFFVDDYKFDNSGDLDKHNGRFTKTPEYPNGVYAYFVGINTNTQTSIFPHYIGNSYRSKVINQEVDQTFDFTNSNLIRNTLPYSVSESGSDNDFINEPNEILLQSSTIESVTKGSVELFDIHEVGQGYKVGDVAKFDNTDTNGGGISAFVDSITGKSIENLSTAIEDYQNAKLIWNNSEVSVHTSQPHTLIDNDNVVLSGISTFISKLVGEHTIGISSEKTILIKQTPAITAAGIVTDIFVATMPNISVGSTIGIGTARLSILNKFPDKKVIRAITEHTAGIHTASTEVIEISDKFTIPLKTSYFESKLDDKIFFNPTQELGIGTVSGQSGISTIVVGHIPTPTSIPYQSIFIPNHPFTQNQEVTLTKGGSTRIVVSDTGDGATFNIPETGDTQNLFIINKSKDLIGLTTEVGLTTSTDGLFFRAFSSNNNDTDFLYSIESNFSQETARVEKIKSTISISTDHGLENGDIITLTVKPKQSLGIGTSESLLVKYNTQYDKILINPISFGSTAVNLSKNEFELTSHGFETGEKVFYNSTNFISGLSTGSYYVHRVDDNKFNLSVTRKDSISEPALLINLGSQGSSHEISKINPPISVIKNNNLVFNMGDASLSGYNMKIFYDSDFYNELVSIGATTGFSVVSAGSTVTVNYSNELPSKIYYSLEKSGFISTADTDVSNYSQIKYEDSKYNGSYTISGVGATVFDISVRNKPEQLSYVKTTSDLTYTTKSYAAEGGVGSLSLTFGGANYKKLPEFVSIASTNGINADIIPVSSTVGRIKEFTINDQGFDFSADRTLNPEVYISPSITIVDRNEITGIEILDGGKGYTSPPDLSLVNPTTGKKYETGVLKAKIQGSSIDSIDVQETPVGLNEVTNLIFAENGDNGVGINSCFSNTAGIVTCFLATPIIGFTTIPFAVGDKVFVEGISLIDNIGDGFNSADNKYNFYDVIAYSNTNPAKLVFDASKFVSSNPGIAVTSQNSFASVIKKSNYPIFEVTQVPKAFNVGEKIFTKNGDAYTERDLIVTENLNDTIKVYGTYDLSVGDQIFGQISGTLATIKLLKENRAIFKVDYSSRKDVGWSNDIGKLNLDYQVLPDNDYYQNLSYTIKSKQTYDTISSTVNGLLHPTGLKNFADTGITSTTKVSVGATIESSSEASLDIITEKRVDTLNFFDEGIDIDTLPDDINPTKSKFIKFNNKKLADYINCISNRVLSIDDFSLEFSNAGGGESELFVDAHDYSILDGYSRFLVQVVDPVGTERQATEIITLPSPSGDIITFEKGSLDNRSDHQIANIEGDLTDGVLSLRFTPFEKFNTDYDIKIIKNKFTSSGIGSTSISVGFVDLVSSNQSVGTGSTVNLIQREVDKTESLFVNAEIINNSTNERTYAEIFVDHDSSNTFASEFYFDNDSNDTISDRFIGTFTSSISSGLINLDYQNTDPNNVTIRTKIVGFGTTASGIGTHIFKSAGQPDDSVKSARLQTNYVSIASTGTVFTVDKSDVSTIKAVSKVGYGNSSALHQFLIINDSSESYITQYPFLPVGTGNTTGIGTFGSEFNGSNLNIKFFPDAGVSNVTVQTHSEIIQTDSDFVNLPEVLSYGSISEEVITSAYNARNGNRVDKTAFNVNHEGTPIFQKTFDPAASLNLTTNVFNVKDHFFNTGEKLTYAAGSSFATVTPVSMKTGGSNIPTTVYAINDGSDEFRLATSRANALAGTAINFSSAGSGNAHTLTMDKKLSKAIISIDGVVQSPIAYTKLAYTLQDNYGSIGAGETVFSLSGIGTIGTGDLLKIDDEFMRVNLVGLGVTALGPIIGSGAFNLVNVERGVVGTTAATHNDGAVARVHLGSYNFVGSKIHFTEPPLGNSTNVFNDETLLPEPRSTFGGRVYTRQDYSTNTVFDSLSKEFTGIGATYTLTVGGANTTGIETGSGVLFLNDVFQTPTTTNNEGNIYSFVEGATGITSVTFTGITDGSNNLIISGEDVNQNQLPRGGVIVSLGSTNGLGFAPLVGAAVTAVKNQSGAITAVGIGTRDTHGSGYRGIVPVTVTDIAYEHRFESAGIGSIRKGSFAGQGYTATNAVYTSNTGVFVITIPNHNLTTSDTVGIDTGGIVFRCSKDHFATLHPYPRSGPTPTSTNGDPIVGQQVAIAATTTDTITINVGAGGGAGTGAVVSATVGVGGTLTFAVTSAGSGYVTPQINIPQPSYENLEVVGVSRLGQGATTETGKNLLISVDVGPTSTVGIGSTLREVKSFKITRPGYAFRKGDVFKPVGLVTDRGLGSVVQEFELTVLETFTDSFASWQFGELDNVDSIRNLQDGFRKRFPLQFNDELLSFEKDEDSEIDLNAVLLIFVNGVIQEPSRHYQFEGGTSFTFTEAPDKDDKVDIFFYRGTRGTDSTSVNIVESVKQGDLLTLNRSNSNPGITQDPRTIYNITTSDKVETNLYTGLGISTVPRPISWTKQKVDKEIAGEFVSKARDSIEPLVYPTARIISDLSTSGTEVFLDNGSLFNYEGGTVNIDALIVNTSGDPVAAAVTATVSAGGTISALTVDNDGSGYSGSATIKISNPFSVGFPTNFIPDGTNTVTGIGSTATATCTVVDGEISGVTIVNPGFGYSQANPPQVIVSIPTVSLENITGAGIATGFSGIVTGISTSTGIGGNPLALEFFLSGPIDSIDRLDDTDARILISDTEVGSGVTSIDGHDLSTVGIGTTYLNNVYKIDAFSRVATAGIITCNILSTTSAVDLVGIASTGTTLNPCGTLSFGRISGFTRSSSPISIGVTGLNINAGLTTFPILQRRGTGLRNTGGLSKSL